jgi:hypothetical protein
LYITLYKSGMCEEAGGGGKGVEKSYEKNLTLLFATTTTNFLPGIKLYL